MKHHVSDTSWERMDEWSYTSFHSKSRNGWSASCQDPSPSRGWNCYISWVRPPVPPPLWVKIRSFGFEILAERQQDDGSVLNSQEFCLYQLVYNSFCPVGSWIQAAGTWRWQSPSVSCWYYPHLCLIFPPANFGQMLNVEFPRNPHVFLYVRRFQSTECDTSDTPDIWSNQL